MMKHKLHLSSTEHFIAVMSLRSFVKSLHSSSRKGFIPFYQMVYDKVVLTNTPDLDGGEMRALVDSLRSNADHSFLKNREIDQEFLIKLSNKIDSERQKYQYQHGPIIKRVASVSSTYY